MVGENLERLRRLARMTQHETVRLFTRRGSALSRSKVAAIEAGERPNLSFADVLVIARAFKVDVSELFAGDGDVVLTHQLSLPRAEVRDLITGASWLDGGTKWGLDWRRELLELDPTGAADEVHEDLQTTEADRALALRLGVAPDGVVEVARSLWGRTLSGERDLRVENLGDMDSGERRAHRGHITRELSREIQSEMVKRGLLTEVVEEAT